MNMVWCRGCGKKIHETAVSCPSCGAQQKVKKDVNLEGGVNNIIAAILAFFLGGFGIHRFYIASFSEVDRIKNIILGILYIVFCWTLIPAIAAFIEGIVFLTGKKSFDEKYN